MKRFILTALTVIIIMCLSACAKEETEEIVLPADAAKISGDALSLGDELFSEEIEPEEGKTVKLSFLGSFGTSYNVDKILMSADGKGDVNIDITQISGEVLMRNDGAVSYDPKLFYTVDDLNFDGYDDFRIQGWISPDGDIPYFCFIWNHEESIYEYAFDVVNPLVYGSKQRIYSTFHDSGSEYFSIYELKDGNISLADSFEVGSSVEFISDISAYEQYMEPGNTSEYLMLVNQERKLDAAYQPGELYSVVKFAGIPKPRMIPCAAMALEALCTEMNAVGYTDVSVREAYLSYDEINGIYNKYINEEMAKNSYTFEEAQNAVSAYFAPPGANEHQTGLCCDMYNLPDADIAFAEEAAYVWLSENAWKFGFILRYPENKTEITGTAFEPWHFRYVGRYHAERITKLGMCLEEYTEYLDLISVGPLA